VVVGGLLTDFLLCEYGCVRIYSVRRIWEYSWPTSVAAMIIDKRTPRGKYDFLQVCARDSNIIFKVLG
jgi:hypothetical protein